MKAMQIRQSKKGRKYYFEIWINYNYNPKNNEKDEGFKKTNSYEIKGRKVSLDLIRAIIYMNIANFQLVP